MSRKMNMAFARCALMIMSGLAMGQTAGRSIPLTGQIVEGRIGPRTGLPSDPCSPVFPGTVYIPCNPLVGSMVWNDARGRYDVRLDDASLKQAYAQVVQQTPAQSAISRRLAPPEYDPWVKAVRDMFEQVASQALSAGSPQNPTLGYDGTAMKLPPIKVDLNLNLAGGHLGGSLTLSWVIK